MAAPTSIPRELARVRALMGDFPRQWALSGGWAVDGWLGRMTRRHLDVDLSIWLEDQAALREFLRDGWILSGHDPHDDDSTHDWDGHALELPAHVHARAEGFELDVQLNLRDGDEWVFRQEPRIARPIDLVIVAGPWAMPALAPVAILYYKGHADIRGHDEADYRLLLPLLGAGDRAWLAAALRAIRPDHPWLADLEGGAGLSFPS